MNFETVVTDWLLRRKITPSVLKEFNVRGVAGRIVIPILTREGVFSFNKYRRSPLMESGPKYTYDKGAHMELFGAWQARNEGRVMWCEGELDALACWSANMPAVSSTGGANSIDERWGEWFAGKEVIVCFDNDKAGGEGMVKALMVVPWAKVLFLPKGIKDISEYVERGGKLEGLVKGAVQLANYTEVVADRSERLALFGDVYFHDAYVRIHTDKPEKKERRISRDDASAVERARAVPVDSLVTFDSRGMTKCLWHMETEGSLHYYEKTNSCYCFGGCGHRYDAIDVYMKLNDVGFKEAVERMQ